MASSFAHKLFVTVSAFAVCIGASGCAPEAQTSDALKQNTRLELVDWHISGLWVINAPVCWVRVANYNNKPIKEVTLAYTTYGYEGQPLDHGTYTLDGEIPPMSMKNFAEQYVGLVNVESDQISISLVSVKEGDGSGGGH